MSTATSPTTATPCDVVALAALAGVAGGIAAVDVVLIRSGHAALSSVVRRSLWLRLVAVALVVHVVATVPHDPLTALARRIQPSPQPKARTLRVRPLTHEEFQHASP